jgi:hypothetical protein
MPVKHPPVRDDRFEASGHFVKTLSSPFGAAVILLATVTDGDL